MPGKPAITLNKTRRSAGAKGTSGRRNPEALDKWLRHDKLVIDDFQWQRRQAARVVGASMIAAPSSGLYFEL